MDYNWGFIAELVFIFWMAGVVTIGLSKLLGI